MTFFFLKQNYKRQDAKTPRKILRAALTAESGKATKKNQGWVSISLFISLLISLKMPWRLGVLAFKYVRLLFEGKMRNLLRHEGHLEEKRRLLGCGY
jgi:hypothetical protein